MFRTLTIAALVLCLAGSAAALDGTETLVIHHSGRLLGANDQPVSGQVRLSVRLYTKSDGASSDVVWTDTWNLAVVEGLYSIVLGDTAHDQKPLTAAAVAGDRWLAVVIGELEMFPRFQLGLAPAALDARNLGGRPAADYALKTDKAPDSDKLANKAPSEFALKTDTAPDADKLGGALASLYARKTDTAPDAELLGGQPPSMFALKTDKAPDSDKLGGALAAVYALKTDKAPDADKLGGALPSAYALKTDKAPDSDKLGGALPAAYALKTDKAPDSDKLGGALPGAYALANHNHDGVYVKATGGGDLSLTGFGTFGGLNLTGQTASRPTCDSTISGRIYFDLTNKIFFACDGQNWFGFAGTGVTVGTQATPGTSCRDIKTRNPTASDGVYWIAPASATYQVYCDMTTDGGGWTLVANVAPGDGNSVGYNNQAFWTGTAEYGNFNNRFANDYKSAAMAQLSGASLMIQSTAVGASGAILGWRRWPMTSTRTFGSFFGGGIVGVHATDSCETQASDAVSLGSTANTDDIIRQGTCLYADVNPSSSGEGDTIRLTTIAGNSTDNNMSGFAACIDCGVPWQGGGASYMGLDRAACGSSLCAYNGICRAGTDCVGSYCSSTYSGTCSTSWNSRFFVK